MGLRIVFVFVVFLAVTFGVGLPLANDLPVIPGFGPGITAMFLGAGAAFPLFILLVVIPSTRNRPE